MGDKILCRKGICDDVKRESSVVNEFEEDYEVYPEEKTSQKAKGWYNRYKVGGQRRTQKNVR